MSADRTSISYHNRRRFIDQGQSQDLACPRVLHHFSFQCSGSSKWTPTEVTSRRPSPDLPIIGLEALLSLVEWIEERRIQSQQGGPQCDDHRANVSPPAPGRIEGATITGPALAGSDRRPAAANAPGAQSRRGSSTGDTSGR